MMLTLRKIVGVTFALIYLLFGIPLWYKLTNIYRAPLPIKYIQSLHDDKFQDIKLTIPVFIKSEVYKFPDIHDAVQVQVNHLLNTKRQYVEWSLQLFPYNETLIEEKRQNNDEYHIVQLQLDDFIGYGIPHDSKTTVIYYDDRAVLANDLPYFIAQALIEHSFRNEWNQLSLKPDVQEPTSFLPDETTIHYSPEIHLSFSLINGGSAPIEWDIDSSFNEILAPYRKLLQPLVNFTVDTRTLTNNDLNLHSLGDMEEVSSETLSHIVDLSELNSGNDYNEDNSLNFVVLFPNAETNPDGYKFIPESTTNWNSYSIPRWGALFINRHPVTQESKLGKNYMNSIVLTAIRHISSTLGIQPKVLTEDEGQSFYTMIDSYRRIRIIENLKNAVNTLWSLVELTKDFEQMAIPSDVLENVNMALELRLEVIDILNNPSKGSDSDWNEALKKSNDMVHYCEKAFFHGDMVQQNYFPQEHKVAVYLPLIGPLTIVLITGLKTLFAEKDVKKAEAVSDKKKPVEVTKYEKKKDDEKKDDEKKEVKEKSKEVEITKE